MGTKIVVRYVRAVAAVAGMLALAACGSGGSGGPAPSSGQVGGYGAPAQTSAAPASEVALATASTSLGTIVVDGRGMTVYQYDKDTQGATTSACSGQCASLWPPVHAGSGTPQLDGVTGTVSTITGTDGEPQLTLDGWPLYTYASDTAPGDVMGQGVGGIWWVLSPAGERITG